MFLTAPGDGDLGLGDFGVGDFGSGGFGVGDFGDGDFGDFFGGVRDSLDVCLTGVLGLGVFLTFPSGWKGGGTASGLGGRGMLPLTPPPPCPFPVPGTTTFLNSSLVRLEGLTSSPWRLEFRLGTDIPVAFGGGTSGLSGLGGLSGFWFLFFGTGLAFGDDVGDLLRPDWRIKEKCQNVSTPSSSHVPKPDPNPFLLPQTFPRNSYGQLTRR